MPEDAVGSVRMVLNVSLEDFFPICPSIGINFVGMQAGVSKVKLH